MISHVVLSCYTVVGSRVLSAGFIFLISELFRVYFTSDGLWVVFQMFALKMPELIQQFSGCDSLHKDLVRMSLTNFDRQYEEEDV